MVLSLFFFLDKCSAISFKRSRRELSIDVAEHRFTLKININTQYPRFSFIPKTGTAFPKTGFVFVGLKKITVKILNEFRLYRTENKEFILIENCV